MLRLPKQRIVRLMKHRRSDKRESWFNRGAEALRQSGITAAVVQSLEQRGYVLVYLLK